MNTTNILNIQKILVKTSRYELSLSKMKMKIKVKIIDLIGKDRKFEKYSKTNFE